MSVRIGTVEFQGLQKANTKEIRNLIQQEIPGQSGHRFQDLGREPVTLELEGYMWGDDVLGAVEKLRQAQVNAKPLPFSADIAVGTDFVDVIIEDISINQQAGYQNRYWFHIVIREYIEPPEPVNLSMEKVNASVLADAKSWTQDALSAASVLGDPSMLPGLLSGNMALLDNLDMGDLGKSIADMAGSITGGDFSGILSAIGSIDIEKMTDLVKSVCDAGSLGEMIDKIADEGLAFIGDELGINLGMASSIIKSLAGGQEFLKRLKRVKQAAEALSKDIKNFDPLKDLRELSQIRGD